MLTKTSRAIGESSCQSVIAGAMPDASVPSAASDADDEDDLMRLRQAPAHGRESTRAVDATGFGAAERYWTDLGVGLAQALGHAGEQLAREAGDLVDDAGELALAEHDELHRRSRRRRSRCGAPCRAGRARRRRRPGPSVATLRPWRRHRRPVPSRITKNSLPVSPSLTRTLPGVDLHVLGPSATSWRSLREQAEKSGTCGEVVDEGVTASHGPGI